MSELIIIAGPQAAGKSTVIDHLNNQFRSAAALLHSRNIPVLMPMQESRQIIVHKNMLLGAIFMTIDDEQEVIDCDFHRMDLIIKRNSENLVYIDECNIFTLAHAKARGLPGIDKHINAYLRYLERLKAKVIFIDVPPTTSWERRKDKYEQRLIYFPGNQHRKVMQRYRQYLEDLHPHLHTMYKQLPFPKAMIDGDTSLKILCKTVTAKLAQISSFF